MQLSEHQTGQAVSPKRFPYRHGAVLFNGSKTIATASNSDGGKACGFTVPCCHAEANVLRIVASRTARECNGGRMKSCLLRDWHEKGSSEKQEISHFGCSY